MSWQDYVDNQLIASQCVNKACIAGHDGGVWAKSEGFEVSYCINCKNLLDLSPSLASSRIFQSTFLLTSRRSNALLWLLLSWRAQCHHHMNEKI